MAPPLVQHLVNETDHLQDEIRQLEREYNTLLHKSSIFSESCQRGYNESEDMRRDQRLQPPIFSSEILSKI